jgi:hypothetical protein
MCLVLFCVCCVRVCGFICVRLSGSRIVGVVDNSGKSGSQKNKDSTATVIGTMSAGVDCVSAVFRLCFGCVAAVFPVVFRLCARFPSSDS